MNFGEFKEKAIQKTDKIRYQVTDAARRGAEKGRCAVKWCIDHPDKFAALVGGIAVANKLARNVKRSIVMEHEIYDKKRRIYDQSLKGWLYVKRPLTSRDIQRINEERRRTGKRVSEILAEMDLLKK